MARARVADIGMPDFGPPGPRPSIPPEAYAGRIARLQERAVVLGYDHLVVLPTGSTAQTSRS